MAKLSDLKLLDVGHTIQMVGTIYAGNGKLYLCPYPTEGFSVYAGSGRVLSDGTGQDTVEVEILDMDAEDWSTFLRQTDFLETEVTARSADGSTYKAVVRKSQRQISQVVSWNVFRRDHYQCRYCARGDVPLTVDHLVLWEDGGPSIEANLLSSCKKCNKVRGNTTYEEWLNHPHYRAVSRSLSAQIKEANLALVPTLAAIPRTPHQGSR